MLFLHHLLVIVSVALVHAAHDIHLVAADGTKA